MLKIWEEKKNKKKLTIKSFLKETWSKKSPTLPFPFQLQLPSRAIVNTVGRYAASLNKDQIITAANNILLRAQACIVSDGGAFEYKLKSFKKRLNR